LLSNRCSRGADDESIEVVDAEIVVAMEKVDVKEVGDDTSLIFVRRESSKLTL